MRTAARPILFDDDAAVGEAARPSPVARARRSPGAPAKAATDGEPVHSFATRLQDLTTMAANRIQPAGTCPPSL